MNLLIHDLSQDEWEKTAQAYSGWTVVSEQRQIHPCVGCFGCWNRTPGICVIKDGFENMGRLIHEAEEVTVISRYTYGGFSGFVKNVFDRCLGYVLPQFEIVGGETHHKKRYDEDKAFTFLFYGQALAEEEKAATERYVRAVCANFRGHVKAVDFKEPLLEEHVDKKKPVCTTRKTTLLVGSMRGIKGNSGILAKKLADLLAEESEILTIQNYMQDLDKLVSALKDADKIVLCIPLYVDGLPSQVIRLMELFEQNYAGAAKKVYVLTNMGLYESCQLVNLFTSVKLWCSRMGFSYCGGLGVSAGELVGSLMKHIPFRIWITKHTAKGMKQLAAAITEGSEMTDLFTEPYAFPRPLYIAIANAGWRRMARANGLHPADLYQRL